MLILKDFVKKDKEIDFEGRCFIVDFFFLSQYCENAVESQKKWLFLYQSCQSQYNDRGAMMRLNSNEKGI